MDIAEWWPKLGPATRDWLIAHNGDVLAADLALEISEAGGSPTGFALSDEETDWIEAVANDEDAG